jgi:hypothetical protein
LKQIRSKLILASRNEYTGDVLYTFVLTYPRNLLAEMNTHRAFSRNTASSRAVPSKKYRAAVLSNPFTPLKIGAQQKGMQAGQELSGWRRRAVEAIWNAARYPNVLASYLIEKLGAHKQVGNRLLEPWVWVEQIVSTTDLKNFFALRDHWMAEPHFQMLAKQMHEQVDRVNNLLRFANEHGRMPNPMHFQYWIPSLGESVEFETTVQRLKAGQWHLPFVTPEDQFEPEFNAYNHYEPARERTIEELKKISAARCARVSYYLPENGQRSDIQRDIELYDRLVVRGVKEFATGFLGGPKTDVQVVDKDPIHASPVEHQATPMTTSTYSGNFKGFMQHRKELQGEDGGDRS